MIKVNLTDNKKYQYNPQVDTVPWEGYNVTPVVPYPKLIHKNTSNKPQFKDIYQTCKDHERQISSWLKGDMKLNVVWDPESEREHYWNNWWVQ